MDEFTGTSTYVLDDELKEIVNITMALEMPLLLKGEPGTGKTLLAHEVAQALAMPLYVLNVKSSMKARDALYHYDTCGFCRRVRAAIDALGLDIELRNVMEDRTRYQELLTHGGRTTVPCLCIGKGDPATAQWMYESADIIAYLVERYGPPS